jgi:hypothetical protein
MSTKQQQLREEFWKGHLSSWKKSPLELHAYCKEHGISHHTFYYWRKKLGSRLPAVRKSIASTKTSPFIPVEVRAEAGGLPGGDLPSAKWLAEFAVHFIRGLR